MRKEPGSLIEWLVPIAFIVCAGWAIWHIPAYLLDFIPPSDQSLHDQISALHKAKDVSPNLSGLFGGVADILDYAALILLPIIFWIGVLTVAFRSFLNLPADISNIVFVAGLVAVVIGPLIRSGQFGGGKF